MSIHLLNVASEIVLPSHLKLALMCMADSGSKENNIAHPGIAGVMKWCCVKEAQAYKLIGQLEELQLVKKTRGGYRGRNSEYLVFPNGCCVEHGKQPAAVAPAVTMDTITEAAETVIQDSPVGESWRSDAQRDAALCTLHPHESLAEPKILLDPTRDSPQSPQHSTGHAQIPALRTYSEQQPPSGYLTGPVTSRDAGPTLDFTRVVDLMPWEAPAAPPPGEPCTHCDDGVIVDRHGLPVANCTFCQQPTDVVGTVQRFAGHR